MNDCPMSKFANFDFGRSADRHGQLDGVEGALRVLLLLSLFAQQRGFSDPISYRMAA